MSTTRRREKLAERLAALTHDCRFTWGQSASWSDGVVEFACQWIGGGYLATVFAGFPPPEELERLVFSVRQEAGTALAFYQTDHRGQFRILSMQPGEYRVVFEHVGVGVAGEGLTARLHNPARFDELLSLVAPLILERVSLSRAYVPAFREYVASEPVWEQLQQARHVRDTIGHVLSDFCCELNLDPYPEPECFLDRNVMDNVLWQVTTVICHQLERDPEKLQALDAVDSSLRKALKAESVEPPERTIEFALANVGSPRTMADIRNRLLEEFHQSLW